MCTSTSTWRACWCAVANSTNQIFAEAEAKAESDRALGGSTGPSSTALPAAAMPVEMRSELV